MNKFNLSAVIISAGKSGRIGKAKAFLQFQDKSFISEIITKVYKVCNKIIIVFGFDSENMKSKLTKENFPFDLLNRLKIVVNKNYELGMFSSLQFGLNQIKDSDYVLIHQVDQPGLPQDFYFEFVEQIEKDADWIQPEFNNKVGHPIIISNKVVRKILSENSDSNLRIFKNQNDLTMKIWKCNYPQIHQDIDTFEDYKNLLRK